MYPSPEIADPGAWLRPKFGFSVAPPQAPQNRSTNQAADAVNYSDFIDSINRGEVASWGDIRWTKSGGNLKRNFLLYVVDGR